MLQGEPVVLTDMLDCRERRARKQDEYRNKYHTTIISFCMNIPGPIKTNADITKVFHSGVHEIQQYLEISHITVLESVEYNEKTGNELILAVDCKDSKRIKDAMTNIEETHPIGRLFDIDVLDPDGNKMSRNTFRKCFICNCQAQECASRRRHSVPEMQEYIDSKIQEYISGNPITYKSSFDIEDVIDPFYSEQNIAQLHKSSQQIKEGKIITKTLDELTALQKHYYGK